MADVLVVGLVVIDVEGVVVAVEVGVVETVEVGDVISQFENAPDTNALAAVFSSVTCSAQS